MLHAWRRRRHCRLSARLITPSVSRSVCSVTAAADNCVATRPGRVTGQWGARLTGCVPSDPPPRGKVQSIRSRPGHDAMMYPPSTSPSPKDWEKNNRKNPKRVFSAYVKRLIITSKPITITQSVRLYSVFEATE